MKDKPTQPNTPTRGRADLDRLHRMSEEEIERTSPPELENLSADFWRDATITVASDVLKRARALSIEEDPSASAVLGGQLATYADGGPSLRRDERDAAREHREAIQRLIRLSRIPRPAATPPRTTRDADGNRNWKRDDLYDR